MKIIAVGTRFAISPEDYGRLELRVGVSYERDRELFLMHVVGTEAEKLAVYDSEVCQIPVSAHFTDRSARRQAEKLLTIFKDDFYSSLVSPDPKNCLPLSSSPYRAASDFEIVDGETLGGGP